MGRLRQLQRRFLILGALCGALVATTFAVANDRADKSDATAQVASELKAIGEVPTPVEPGVELAIPSAGSGPVSVDRNPPYADISANMPSPEQVETCEKSYEQLAPDEQLVCRVQQAKLDGDLPAGEYSKEEVEEATESVEVSR
jgi:hypothetical protein